MKNIIISFALAAAFVATAEDGSVEAAKEAFAAKSGGLIEKPETATGRIVFINTQSEMSEADIRQTINSLGDVVAKYPVFIESDTPGKPSALKAKHKANIAILIVANDEAPTLLYAPEENWAVVNVRPLADGLMTESAKAKFFNSRCRKELMRGFVCAAGGIDSSFPGNIMNITNIRDLDLREEFIPFDKAAIIKAHLKDSGVTPSRYATYRVACREGWAPAPTNDVQKAIWDKVHEMPTEPIKIKPETKKQDK